jgi:hypothetical protein
MEETIRAILANPVISIKDFILELAVVYFLIYKQIYFRFQDRLAKKRNGGSTPQRRKNDSSNPLSINAGTADICTRHDESIKEIKIEMRLLSDRVLVIETNLKRAIGEGK